MISAMIAAVAVAATPIQTTNPKTGFALSSRELVIQFGVSCNQPLGAECQNSQRYWAETQELFPSCRGILPSELHANHPCTIDQGRADQTAYIANARMVALRQDVEEKQNREKNQLIMAGLGGVLALFLGSLVWLGRRREDEPAANEPAVDAPAVAADETEQAPAPVSVVAKSEPYVPNFTVVPYTPLPSADMGPCPSDPCHFIASRRPSRVDGRGIYAVERDQEQARTIAERIIAQHSEDRNIPKGYIDLRHACLLRDMRTQKYVLFFATPGGRVSTGSKGVFTQKHEHVYMVSLDQSQLDTPTGPVKAQPAAIEDKFAARKHEKVRMHRIKGDISGIDARSIDVNRMELQHMLRIAAAQDMYGNRMAFSVAADALSMKRQPQAPSFRAAIRQRAKDSRSDWCTRVPYRPVGAPAKKAKVRIISTQGVPHDDHHAYAEAVRHDTLAAA